MNWNNKSSIFYILAGAIIVVLFFILLPFSHSETLVPMLLDMLSLVLLIIAFVSLPKDALSKALQSRILIHPPPRPTLNEGNQAQLPAHNIPSQQIYRDNSNRLQGNKQEP